MRVIENIVIRNMTLGDFDFETEGYEVEIIEVFENSEGKPVDIGYINPCTGEYIEEEILELDGNKAIVEGGN